MNKLVNFLVAGGLFISGLASAQFYRYRPFDELLSITNNLEITTSTFQEYTPKKNNSIFGLEDKLLERYIQEPFSITDLAVDISAFYHAEVNKLEETIVYDEVQFQRDVISVAKELGYSKHKIKNLSINESVLLSGLIVSYQLDTDSSLIIPVGTENPSQELIDFDNEYEDRIFNSGRGICKHFSSVNAAVFDVLKKYNKKLNNTYMKFYGPEDAKHAFSLLHAWNMVTTIEYDKKNNSTHLDITFVDPTFLESVLERDSGFTKEEMLEAYNAYDQWHFGKDKFYQDIYVADLVQVLNNPARFKEYLPKIEYTLDEKEYNDELAITREKSIYNLTDKALNEDENVFFLHKLCLEFDKQINEYLGVTPIELLEPSLGATVKLDSEGVRKLISLYNEVTDVVPELKESPLTYTIINHEDSSNTIYREGYFDDVMNLVKEYKNLPPLKD